MNIDWQELAALSLVALACGYLLRQGWRLLGRNKTPGGCGGGCPKCPSTSTAQPVLHQLDAYDNRKAHN